MKKNIKVISSYNKALAIDSKSTGALYKRACAYALSGNKAKALNDLSKAIELNVEMKDGAKKEKGFKSLWSDPDFKKITN